MLNTTTFGTFGREYSPDVAPAVNPVEKSSRRVRYLRATVEVSNFCKALLLHDFRKRVARESLRRAFGKGRCGTLGVQLEWRGVRTGHRSQPCHLRPIERSQQPLTQAARDTETTESIG